MDTTDDASKYVFLFGDESSHKGDSKFMVYGLASCPDQTAVAIKDRLTFPDFDHEFKWKKCGHQIEAHKKFVNAIFDCIRTKQFRFECIVVNRHHMDNAKYNDSDSDLALEKYIYRKLLNTSLKTAPDVRFVVRLDKGREKNYPPEDMERMLNLGYRKEHPLKLTHSPFRSVKVVESHRSRFVQAADVLSGAVAWVWNKRYNDKDKGEDKESLAALVARRFDTKVTDKLALLRGVKQKHYLSLGYETASFAERGFSIWDFDLRKKKADERRQFSAEQLAAIPDPDTRFRDLARANYQINVECVYCNDKIRNSLDDDSLKRFNSLRVVTKERPICMECGRKRIAILHPDPRSGLLHVHFKRGKDGMSPRA